jgi:hypothetical protein
MSKTNEKDNERVDGEISSDLYCMSGFDNEKRHFPKACKTKEKFYPLLLYTKSLQKCMGQPPRVINSLWDYFSICRCVTP